MAATYYQIIFAPAPAGLRPRTYREEVKVSVNTKVAVTRSVRDTNNFQAHMLFVSLLAISCTSFTWSFCVVSILFAWCT